MKKKYSIDPSVIDHITENMFTTIPLLRKRLLCMDVVLKEHSIPLSQIQVLALLQQSGSLSVSEISRILGIAKPNITPLVDKLYDLGMVERKHSETDRRVVNISLLPLGTEMLQKIRATCGEEIRKDFESTSISAADARKLDEALRNISDILSTKE